MSGKVPGLAIACVLVSCLPGCRERSTAEEGDVARAFDELMAAMEHKDAAALWGLCGRSTRAFFEETAAGVKRAMELVDACYPEKDRKSVRRDIGAALLRPDGSGRDLFLSLVDEDRLRAPANPEARRLEKVIVSGDTAVVVTGSGDTVRFVRGPGGAWLTDVLGEEARRLPALSTLRENLDRVLDGCGEDGNKTGSGAP